VQLSAEGGAHVRVTNLERTLIDAVVRPAYSGGVFEVAKAFELAKDQVSVNAMGAMLGKLRFAYPFHQPSATTWSALATGPVLWT